MDGRGQEVRQIMEAQLEVRRIKGKLKKTCVDGMEEIARKNWVGVNEL